MTEATGSNDYQGEIEGGESLGNRQPGNTNDMQEAGSGPIGLNIGTSNIVMARGKGNGTGISKQLNAFYAIPQSKFTRQVLLQNEVVFFEHKNKYLVIGDAAENFANMFNADSMRTMAKGFLALREDEGVAIIRAMIKTLVRKPEKTGEVICFTVPGEPMCDSKKTASLGGHEAVIKMYLESLGFTPVAINKGLAVVLAELADENFTGIGISIGGGMCNVCLSYLSVPVITYSIQHGGDDIDEKVGREVGLSATKIKGIKEEGVDLSKSPKNNIELAIQMHYTDLINQLVLSMEKAISSSNKMPKLTGPVSIVIGGGAAAPKGFDEKFESALQSISLPFEISSVRVAKDPMDTAAKGALVMAVAEAQ